MGFERLKVVRETGRAVDTGHLCWVRKKYKIEKKITVTTVATTKKTETGSIK